jgi:DNA-binding transcriptional regulator LsrR (DeoR family)
MLTEDLQPSAREVIVDAITREAATCLDFRFGEEEKPRLAVVYGFITRKIADYLQAEDGLRRSKDARVVSAHGVRSVEIDRFDANTIAHDIGRRFGCEYACLPLPFLIPKMQETAIRELPFVDSVLKILEQDINMALLGLASRHQQEDNALHRQEHQPKSLQNELKLTDEDKRAVAGAAATIGGQWFDYEGNAVDYAESVIPGLKLDKLKKLVNVRCSVLLACGADCTRLPGLAIALKHKMCSIWIGCEASAIALLGDQEVARGDIDWSEQEKSILKDLKNGSYLSGRVE